MKWMMLGYFFAWFFLAWLPGPGNERLICALGATVCLLCAMLSHQLEERP